MKTEQLIKTVRAALPSVQAIYLFGSYQSNDEGPMSDVDIAVLLPHAEAQKQHAFSGTALQEQMEDLFKKPVDLINLRAVSTVFRNEILTSGRRIFCADTTAADEFEMLTFSLYQKLNEERKEVVEDAIQSGRILKP